MRLAVVSPPSADPREVPALGALLAAGLERYHLRKPAWAEMELEAWLLALPQDWRPRIILHGPPALARRLGLGGSHERDEARAAGAAVGAGSRSCHGLASLRRHLGAFPSILFGPVFPSLSKPGYGPAPGFDWGALRALLRETGGARARTLVYAIGGVAAARLPRLLELGFDGAALHGAVWSAPDPARAFTEVRDAAARLEAERHAA